MTLIPTALVTRTDRRPTISFPRLEFLEPDIQAAFFWNGARAPNGDGVPGGEAAIDYATALYGPAPIFRGDQIKPFGGRFGRGGFGERHALHSPSGGFGGGPFAAGAFGVGGSFFSWRFTFPLRDGDYQIAALYADSLGNLPAPPGTVMVLRVEALPRPAADLAWMMEPGIFSSNWTHTPEFAAT